MVGVWANEKQGVYRDLGIELNLIDEISSCSNKIPLELGNVQLNNLNGLLDV